MHLFQSVIMIYFLLNAMNSTHFHKCNMPYLLIFTTCSSFTHSNYLYSVFLLHAHVNTLPCTIAFCKTFFHVMYFFLNGFILKSILYSLAVLNLQCTYTFVNFVCF